MGVPGLWSLLTPHSTPAPLDALRGLTVAVDASIWAHHVVAHRTDRDGRVIPTVHIERFLRRLLKLHYYGIRAVFVFDGTPPALKTAVLQKRRAQKVANEDATVRAARRMLAAQMARKVLEGVVVIPPPPIVVEDVEEVEAPPAHHHSEIVAWKAPRWEGQAQHRDRLREADAPRDFSALQLSAYLAKVQRNTDHDELLEKEQHEYRVAHAPEGHGAVVSGRTMKAVRSEAKTFYYLGPRVGGVGVDVGVGELEGRRPLVAWEDEEVEEETDDDDEVVEAAVVAPPPPPPVVEKKTISVVLYSDNDSDEFERVSTPPPPAPLTSPSSASPPPTVPRLIPPPPPTRLEEPTDAPTSHLHLTLAQRLSDVEADATATYTALAAKVECSPQEMGSVLSDLRLLLGLLGIPHVTSPSEADSQCAYMNAVGLVDAVVSDDSDVLVFGATCVLRDLFSSRRAEPRMYVTGGGGLTHGDLIALACLMGGDYSDGLRGVGERTAMAVVTAFGGSSSHSDPETEARQCLEAFAVWKKAPGARPVTPSEDVVPYDDAMACLRWGSGLPGLTVPPDMFPSPAVLAAYARPNVHRDMSPPVWKEPQWSALAGYAQRTLHERYRVMEPLLTAASRPTSYSKTPKQRTLDRWVVAAPPVSVHAMVRAHPPGTAVSREELRQWLAKPPRGGKRVARDDE